MNREQEAGAIHMVEDTYGNTIQQRFLEYLNNPHRHVAGNDSDTDSAASYENEFESQVNADMEKQLYTIVVDFKKLEREDEELAFCIRDGYHRLLPFLEKATLGFVNAHLSSQSSDPTTEENVLLSFTNLGEVKALRDVRSEHIGKLICISGTVTRTTDVKPELISGTFICDVCHTVIHNIDQQFQFTKPTRCSNRECSNRSRFTFDMNGSRFLDWQRVKMQENTSEIPAGSMPRSMDLILRESLVETVKPGDKVVAAGTLIVIPDVSQLMRQGQPTEITRGSEGEEGVTGYGGLGVRTMIYKTAFLCSSIASVAPSEEDILSHELTADWKRDVLEMRNTALLYQKLSSSLATNIYGHEDIKRGLLLQLIGGVHKQTADGGSIRGDINICIVGDPSTAKSQFLKYINSISPRSVYTSGKSSSAAGLTVGVGRDVETGEMCLEAGALMLSDNGICCIDEFDKMDYADQVAIHEAMEQQTISITKAGITATLNARASILAAANPIGGRYDRSKSLKANISLTAPLMSRFDLFFVILDECDAAIDRRIASHIIKTRRQGGRLADGAAEEAFFTTEQIQHYVDFARQFNPVISPEAQEMLVDCYRILRQDDAVGSRTQTAYRITVRQLESLIRLSEALARLQLDNQVRPSYVKEAFRLLRQSIIHVESADVNLDEPDEWMVEEEAKEEPEKRSVHLTYEEYKNIANMIVVLIRSEKEHERAETGNEEPKGVKLGFAVSSVLRALRIEDPEEMMFKKKVVKMVIKRLITKDHVLITSDIANLEEDDWLIDVHPNYVME